MILELRESLVESQERRGLESDRKLLNASGVDEMRAETQKESIPWREMWGSLRERFRINSSAATARTPPGRMSRATGQAGGSRV